MIGQLMRGSALVLLVCAASSLAVDSLVITRMTWSYTADSGAPESNMTELTVCTEAENLADAGDFIRLVVAKSGDQKPFEGSLGPNTSCAQFSEGGDLPLPSAEAAFYKLTVSNSTGEELKSGNVSFAYPVTASEIIDCGGTKLGRLTLAGTTSAPPNCLQGSGLTPELCYVDPEESNTVCVKGLDAGSDVEVCEANIPEAAADPLDAFAVKYISYSDVNASLGVSHGEADPGALTELLSRVGDDGSVTVHSCTVDTCLLSSFTPSIDKYELCGVFTDNDVVVHVNTAKFQDLKLTVDSTSPTVDFHFYNVEATYYNVYEDADLNVLGGETVSFTLDCTRISAGSYCNGFILPGGNTPTTIAVSFTNATNAVAISVESSPSEPDKAVVSRAAGDGEDVVDLQPSW